MKEKISKTIVPLIIIIIILGSATIITHLHHEIKTAPGKDFCQSKGHKDVTYAEKSEGKYNIICDNEYVYLKLTPIFKKDKNGKTTKYLEGFK